MFSIFAYLRRKICVAYVSSPHHPPWRPLPYQAAPPLSCIWVLSCGGVRQGLHIGQIGVILNTVSENMVIWVLPTKPNQIILGKPLIIMDHVWKTEYLIRKIFVNYFCTAWICEVWIWTNEIHSKERKNQFVDMWKILLKTNNNDSRTWLSLFNRPHMIKRVRAKWRFHIISCIFSHRSNSTPLDA